MCLCLWFGAYHECEGVTHRRHVELTAISAQVDVLRADLRAAELQLAGELAKVNPDYRASAVNLTHYLALRLHDLRDLQPELARLGLSSLGRTEPHVQATLNALASSIDALLDRRREIAEPVIGFGASAELLRRRTSELFGSAPMRRATRIMVTLPSDAAGDSDLVDDLVERGMDLARINTAHDDRAEWLRMITHVRAASARSARGCRIAMDLAGPKLRTGPLVEGPRVVRLRPRRDLMGRVTAPAHARLVAADDGAGQSQAHDDCPSFPVDPTWLQQRRVGETLTTCDTRGARRRLVIESADEAQARFGVEDTSYLGTDTVLHSADGTQATIGLVPPVEQYLALQVGDLLVLTRDCSPAEVGGDGPARIGCTLGEAFERALPGHLVQLDDGKLTGTIVKVDTESITVQITNAGLGGSRLRAQKGINLPETVLPVTALSDADRTNLRLIAANADIVQVSFVRTAADVADLLDALTPIAHRELGIVLKIETAAGFENLPEILLTAMRWPRIGVMIARGDLAVECGYERLAELKEEILWLCEAAHVPVIWATQVLDRMARSGHPSRAEVTDAAMGVRAECVMLNKGPHIREAVTALDDILSRMSTHHDKKSSLMRSLHSWNLSEQRDDTLAV